jgi:hypothetical protein
MPTCHYEFFKQRKAIDFQDATGPSNRGPSGVPISGAVHDQIAFAWWIGVRWRW